MISSMGLQQCKRWHLALLRCTRPSPDALPYVNLKQQFAVSLFESDTANCFGAQARNRTTDTRIFSPLLYRLSYLGTPGSSVIAQG